MHAIRILHISDLHERAGNETDSFRRSRVFGDAWHRNLDELAETLPHFVCFTGDIANWGRKEEYDVANEFIETTCTRLRVAKNRLFIVPGNHDISRRVGATEWGKFRSIVHTDYNEIDGWLGGGPPPRDLSDDLRNLVLGRQAAYRTWVRNVLERPELLPTPESPHPHLGYRSTVELPEIPFPVHIIGLDSAWLAGDDNDNGKLLLTRTQVGRLASSSSGGSLPGFRLALMHHPLDQLADGAQCRRLLAERVDVLLRGHLHDGDMNTWKDPSRKLIEVAAGCLYESDRHPNSCHLLTVYCNNDGRPQHGELRIRSWSDTGSHWYDDNSLTAGMSNGRFRWSISDQSHEAHVRLDDPNEAAPLSSALTSPNLNRPMPSSKDMTLILCQYINSPKRIKRILGDIGIDVNEISFEGPIMIIWRDALDEVVKHRRLNALFIEVSAEYPESIELRKMTKALPESV